MAIQILNNKNNVKSKQTKQQEHNVLHIFYFNFLVKLCFCFRFLF